MFSRGRGAKANSAPTPHLVVNVVSVPKMIRLLYNHSGRHYSPALLVRPRQPNRMFLVDGQHKVTLDAGSSLIRMMPETVVCIIDHCGMHLKGFRWRGQNGI